MRRLSPVAAAATLALLFGIAAARAEPGSTSAPPSDGKPKPFGSSATNSTGAGSSSQAIGAPTGGALGRARGPSQAQPRAWGPGRGLARPGRRYPVRR